jgi:hypothetical protein
MTSPLTTGLLAGNAVTAPTFPLPTIHLNGTGRDTLLRDYSEAYTQLIKFRDAFARIEFNARDFYVQGSDAFPRARSARDELRLRIGQLMEYLEAHLAHLAP